MFCLRCAMCVSFPPSYISICTRYAYPWKYGYYTVHFYSEGKVRQCPQGEHLTIEATRAMRVLEVQARCKRLHFFFPGSLFAWGLRHEQVVIKVSATAVSNLLSQSPSCCYVPGYAISKSCLSHSQARMKSLLVISRPQVVHTSFIRTSSLLAVSHSGVIPGPLLIKAYLSRSQVTINTAAVSLFTAAHHHYSSMSPRHRLWNRMKDQTDGQPRDTTREMCA